MCGIVGMMHKKRSITEELYKSLFYIQHRGQQSSGLVIFSTASKKILKSKEFGLIDTHLKHLEEFQGNMGIGHVRYPTNGENTRNEIQPLSISTPFSISLVHNGNLTNTEYLKNFLHSKNVYLKGTSDSELLLYLFYYFIEKDIRLLSHESITRGIHNLYDMCSGSFSVIIMIHDYGIICFRDKYGIRPLVYSESGENLTIASETMSLSSTKNYKNVNNGEILIFTKNMQKYSERIYFSPLKPCLFEYIYFASAESYVNDILVYEFRERIGEEILKIMDEHIMEMIDIVVPVPITSIVSATTISTHLGKPLKHAIVKNRYTHRTFINEGNDIIQNIEKIQVITKLVENKNVLVVDDSIVRGNTCRHIISELRKANVKSITFACCCPPIRYPNKYGINIPSYDELIAFRRSIEDIQTDLDIDKLYYLPLENIRSVICELNPSIQDFEHSCFTGEYITFPEPIL